MSDRVYDAAVIGAGPYGLAVVAHLRAAGADVRVFGEPLEFWRNNMPQGMLLRSHRDASHIADPTGALTLDAFERAERRRLSQPTPREGFIAYGHWFQQRAAPDVDARRVRSIEPGRFGFRAMLADGEAIEARRMIVAAGLAPFVWRPPQFDGLAPDLCTHSSDHVDLSRFRGERVIVVGGGQSALETAALLCETGADVEVVIRARQLTWLGRSRSLGPLRSLLFPRTDVGPAFLGHVAGRPSLFRRLPRDLQRRLARLSTRPAVAGWLHGRTNGLAITTGRTISSARPALGGGLRVELDDGTARDVHHAVLATGYRIDVNRYPFLAPVLGALRQNYSYPELDAGCQSSVHGLYFVGASATLAFGPVVRFVSGTGYASRAVVRSITGGSGVTVEASAERSSGARDRGSRWTKADVVGSGVGELVTTGVATNQRHQELDRKGDR